MGFGISCKGADLLKSLKQDEASVLGRIYPLYIITLATEVDDTEIEWLTKNGRALDSLTGDLIAFLVFYNSAKFSAKSNSYGNIDLEGTRNIFNYEMPTINVPSYAIQGAWSIRDYVQGSIDFPKEAFVTSMTYESDNLARALNIKPDMLPCLVLIDDPSSGDFYTIPFDGTKESTFNEIRNIVGQFQSENKYQNYFSAIKKWDALQQKLLKQPTAKKIDIKKSFNSKGYEEASKAFLRNFEKRLTEIEVTYLNEFLQIYSNKQRINKIEESFNRNSHYNAVGYRRLYKRYARHFANINIDFKKIEISRSLWKDTFDKILSNIEVYRETNSLELDEFAAKLNGKYYLAPQKKVSEIQHEINKIKSSIRGMERPKISNILLKKKIFTQGNYLKKTVSDMANSVVNSSSSLSRIIETFMKLT